MTTWSWKHYRKSWTILICLFYYDTMVTSECVPTSSEQLIPTNPPKELKEFFFNHKTSSTVFIFTKLIFKSLLGYFEENPFLFYKGKRTFKNVVHSLTFLYTNVKNLDKSVESKIKVGRLLTGLKAFSKSFIISYGGTDVYSFFYRNTYLNPGSIRSHSYRQGKHFDRFKFQLIVPFDFHINITFSPAPNTMNDKVSSTCSFIMCVKLSSRWDGYHDNICNLFSRKFLAMVLNH